MGADPLLAGYIVGAAFGALCLCVMLQHLRYRARQVRQRFGAALATGRGSRWQQDDDDPLVPDELTPADISTAEQRTRSGFLGAPIPRVATSAMRRLGLLPLPADELAAAASVAAAATTPTGEHEALRRYMNALQEAQSSASGSNDENDDDNEDQPRPAERVAARRSSPIRRTPRASDASPLLPTAGPSRRSGSTRVRQPARTSEGRADAGYAPGSDSEAVVRSSAAVPPAADVPRVGSPAAKGEQTVVDELSTQDRTLYHATTADFDSQGRSLYGAEAWDRGVNGGLPLRNVFAMRKVEAMQLRREAARMLREEDPGVSLDSGNGGGITSASQQRPRLPRRPRAELGHEPRNDGETSQIPLRAGASATGRRGQGSRAGALVTPTSGRPRRHTDEVPAVVDGNDDDTASSRQQPPRRSLPDDDPMGGSSSTDESSFSVPLRIVDHQHPPPSLSRGGHVIVAPLLAAVP